MRRIHYISISIIVFFITFGSIFILQERSAIKEDDEGGKNGRSGALEALDFWTRSRAYPNNDIPKDKYFKAFQSAKMKTREVPRTLSAGSVWDPIGPLNLQGRSKSVTINPKNPSTVYVGTASGGLWRSYTGGLGQDWNK